MSSSPPESPTMDPEYLKHGQSKPSFLQVSGTVSQWSSLPKDLLITIEEEYLDLYIDKIRFRCVCSSWRSRLSKMPNHKNSRLPWLLIPHNHGITCGFMEPLEKKVQKLELPESGEKVFKGSAYGWVVIAEKSSSIYLVNPLTRARIKLPPRSKFPDVRKYHANKHGKEYLLCNGQLMVCDIGSYPKPIVTEVAPEPSRTPFGDLHLVESSSGIMMVQQCFKRGYIYEPRELYIRKTTSFNIFRLDTNCRNWYQVQSLGDDVLFLGLNSSLAISSHDYPDTYKGNCIYFTDVNDNFDLEGTGRGFDEGVFCLDDNKIEPLPAYVGDSHEVWPAPIWVTPNPY
ncbi:f-box protein [Quercus suber]|uniref:F-box protein n=1 Tax=Quercus suber TaxID=58331 RepID=A0AAW0KQQ5_QUESU